MGNIPLNKITESEIIKLTKTALQSLGLQVQRINTGCFTVGEGKNRRYIRTANKGTLDFEGYDNKGRFLGIECKRPVGGNLSPEQKARIDDINRKGGVAFVVHNETELLETLIKRGCI